MIPPRLTDRQAEVARLVAKGMLNDQVAVILGISIFTVRAHIKAIASALPTGRNLPAKYKILVYYREHPIADTS